MLLSDVTFCHCLVWETNMACTCIQMWQGRWSFIIKCKATVSAVWNVFLTFKHGVLKILHSVMIEPQIGHFAAVCAVFLSITWLWTGIWRFKTFSLSSCLTTSFLFFFFLIFNLKIISDLDCCKDNPKNFLINFTQVSKTLTFYETIINDQTQELLIKHYWLIYRLYFSFISCLSNVPIF